MKDKERSGALTKFEDEELEALLNENPHQTPKELSKQLNVDELTVSIYTNVSKHLKAAGFIHK